MWHCWSLSEEICEHIYVVSSKIELSVLQFPSSTNIHALNPASCHHGWSWNAWVPIGSIPSWSGRTHISTSVANVHLDGQREGDRCWKALLQLSCSDLPEWMHRTHFRVHHPLSILLFVGLSDTSSNPTAKTLAWKRFQRSPGVPLSAHHPEPACKCDPSNAQMLEKGLWDQLTEGCLLARSVNVKKRSTYKSTFHASSNFIPAAA